MATSMPSPDWFARRRYTNNQSVSLSDTTAKTTALAAGTLYVIQADVPWHFNHGAQASVTATTSHFKLDAYQPIEVWTEDTNSDGVAGILPSGTGTMFVLEVK